MDVTSGLIIRRSGMGSGYCQFDACRFEIAAGGATLHCGLLWIWRLGTGGVQPGYNLECSSFMGENIDLRPEAVGPSLAGMFRVLVDSVHMIS